MLKKRKGRPMFEKGDLVSFSPFLFARDSDASFYLTTEMLLWRKKSDTRILTITDFIRSGYSIYYRLAEDPNSYWWVEKALQLANPQTKEELLLKKIKQLWERQPFYKVLDNRNKI